MPLLDRLYVGDAERLLRRWPRQLVDAVVTSPPYFGLRDYGVAGQLGLEKTPEQYIERLAATFRQIHRVLKDTGSVYLNLADSYRRKCLLGIPWRVAERLKTEGWNLRNAVIWHKPNALPTGVKDRYQATYEFVFFLAKTGRKRYFFDLDVVRIPSLSRVHHGGSLIRPTPGSDGRRRLSDSYRPNPLGKNPGDLWSIHPENRPKRLIVPGFDGHFAVFPEKLVDRPILASVPEGGLVLDPFVGSGTVPLVARQLGRHFLGIDISAEYVELAANRLALATQRPLTAHYIRETPFPVQATQPLGPSFPLWGQEAA